MTNEELAGKLDTLNNSINEIQISLIQLVGNPKTPELKGVVERLFDKFEELPCQEHEHRLRNIEIYKLVSNEVHKERNKWISVLLKLVPYIIVAGGGGSLLLYIKELF